MPDDQHSLQIWHIDNGDQFLEDIDQGIVVADTVDEAAQIWAGDGHLEWNSSKNEVYKVTNRVWTRYFFSITYDDDPDRSERYCNYWIRHVGPIEKGRY